MGHMSLGKLLNFSVPQFSLGKTAMIVMMMTMNSADFIVYPEQRVNLVSGKKIFILKKPLKIGRWPALG